MGRKDKKKNDAQKKEQRQQKQASKVAKAAKKAGNALFGSEDIDALLAEFQALTARRTEVQIENGVAPSPRANASFVAHPSKSELILFGGEYYNGREVKTYAELYFYNIPKAEFRRVFVPNPPPPRTSHQAVAVPTGKGGQMWIFGGDYTSPSQKFKHYNDLWCLDLDASGKLTWQQFNLPGAPSPRSGHRMVYFKRKIYLFGGFNDAHVTIRYFDDMYIFDLDKMAWSKVTPAPNAPWPHARSGFGFALHESSGSIILTGGYYSQKKTGQDLVETGEVFSDLWSFNTSTNTWTLLKSSMGKGRSGMSLFSVNQKVCAFGGVVDGSETEDEITTSEFFNDIRVLGIRRKAWEGLEVFAGVEPAKREQYFQEQKQAEARRQAAIQAGREAEEQKKREEAQRAQAWRWGASKDKSEGKEKKSKEDSDDSDDDGVDLLKQALEETKGEDELEEKDEQSETRGLTYVWPRRNAMVCVKGPVVYVFGGAFEHDDKEITLNDLHYWDTRKNQWSTIIDNDLQNVVWLKEDEEEDSDESDEENKDDDEEDEDEDEDAEDNVEPEVGEDDATAGIFFARTKEYWLKTAKSQLPNGEDKDIRKLAFQLATTKFGNATGGDKK